MKSLGMMMHKYAIEIFYSAEDTVIFCSAFGKSDEEALEEVKVAMDLWLETAKGEGRKIPRPWGKELLKIPVEETTA
jgi:hypothetical protein